MTDTKQPEALRLADELLFAGRFAHESEDVAARRRINRNSQAAAELRRLHEVNQELVEALKDMLSGWKYIRETHGDLYGVGWDRAERKAQAALAKAEGSK